ncbi:MAG: sulfatase [Deltaproteobacteria bacterium]|nr:sulfatase [Deltaproteobacteria bacterium]
MRKYGLLASALLLLGACGGGDGDAQATGGDEASGAAGSAASSAAFEGLSAQLDLMNLAHLADVDHQGLYVDFGTRAQAKYTGGDWRSGWGSRGADGDTTFARVGRRGRVWFWADAPGPMVARVRIRKVATRALTPYLNNTQIQSVFLQDQPGFQTLDITLPAERVRRGENYFLLTFGDVTQVDGEEVSAEIASIRFVPGQSVPAGEYDAPVWESFRASVELGGSERPALTVHAPSTISYFVEIPANGKLGFSLGHEGDGEVPVKVFITPEGGERTQLFSGQAGARWNDQALDLGPYAGKVARLEFVAEGAAPGRVAFAQPRLLMPEQTPAPRVEPARNVIVLLIDTLRADKLKSYNRRSRVRTPVLDEFATESALFERTQSSENWTKPSCASILTGLSPLTHHANTDSARLPAGVTMLSEHLGENGFRTAMFSANGYVSDRFGFDQGWDHYTNYIRENRRTVAANVFREAGDWIEHNKSQRFFTYIQTIDPHVPYDPPDEYLRMYDRSDYSGQVRNRMTADLLEKAKRNPPQVTFTPEDERRLAALYDGEVSYHDHELGGFIERLKSLGVWENTLFVVVADHGEEFKDHGSWGHGHSVYQELLHVPMMMRYPGAIEAQRVPGVVSSMSIPATVTALVGVPDLPADEGTNLTPLMRGQTAPGPQVAFSFFQDDRRVITSGRYKFIVRGNLTSTLFDLEQDPRERNQLGAGHASIARRYLRVLLGQFLGASDRRHWLSPDQGSGTQVEREDAVMDDTIREQLRALGYAN